MPLTIPETAFVIVVDVVVEVGIELSASISLEQMKRVHGDLGRFSIIGQSIGASGVWQPLRLYIGQFFREE